jgi:hypothetical protein
MAALTVGMVGGSMDLESLRRLVALADFLDFPDEAKIASNVQQVVIEVPETAIKWDKVMTL